MPSHVLSPDYSDLGENKIVMQMSGNSISDTSWLCDYSLVTFPIQVFLSFHISNTFFFFESVIYLFMAVLGLHFCKRTFSSCREQGLLSSCGEWASHCSDFSCCGAWAPGMRFSSCGSRAPEHRLNSCSTWVWLGFPGGSEVKNLPAMQEMQVQSQGLEDPME